nr:immunoglobulin light chain junction region [Macaca mulatta]MOW14014.1 immunoglobulin light chain junction region [Macaca mulatta]MOW14603.1 immunoglobulin light chain junction region [Macaca mulatta]
CHQYNSLPLTF